MPDASLPVDPLRSVVAITPPASRIPTDSTVLCLGSCFAEVIGARLATHCFRALCNPLGPLYNPSSIAQTLQRIISAAPWSEDELFEHKGLFGSFDTHAQLATESRHEALRLLNNRIAEAAALFSQLDTLVITFGTAWVWELKERGRIVANCHRMPAGRFMRRLLPVEEIVSGWTALLEQLYALHPTLRVILSVSPVRHLRENPHGNTVSKAHCICAIHRLEERFPDLYYFPAYEIVLDELRDYRFFGRDHAHISEEAEEYVWQRFVHSALDPKARQLVAALAPLLRAAAHRPRGAAAALRAFAQRQLERIEAVEQQFPETTCTALRDRFAALAAEKHP